MFCCVSAIEASNMLVFSKAMRAFSTSTTTYKWIGRDNFKPLKLPYITYESKKRETPWKKPVAPVPKRLSPTDDWTSIWPVAKTAHPELIMFPLRQGYPLNGRPPPAKECSIELLKIPNFLHLSPPAIKKHCAAIKRFCTKWPEALNSEETIQQHFPMEIVYSDYCYSGPTPREPLARIVTVKVKVSALTLDNHAKDKLLRLVQEKYNYETDVLTLTSDRCPTRKQNFEYLKYVLTALYHESKNVEPWEAEKSEEDMEYYDWDKSQSRKSLQALMQWPKPPSDIDDTQIPRAPEYKKAVSDLINKGETREQLLLYKQAVSDLLGLKQQV